MKTKFKMTGNDETKIEIEVSITSSRYVLTRDEAMGLKEAMKNRIHGVLREMDYDVGQIKESK